MSVDSIRVLFLLAKNRINQAGKCSIRCRVTYLKKRYEFSTGLFINPTHWKSKLQKAKPPNEENQNINTQLSLILNKMNQAFLFLQMQVEDFDVNDVYAQYKGEPVKKDKSVLDVFDLHNSRMEKLVGMEYSKSTYAKFVETRKHLFEFLQKQYGKKDFLLKDLTMKFIRDLDFYFKTERGQSQSTINKHIQRFRKTITLAILRSL